MLDAPLPVQKLKLSRRVGWQDLLSCFKADQSGLLCRNYCWSSRIPECQKFPNILPEAINPTTTLISKAMSQALVTPCDESTWSIIYHKYLFDCRKRLNLEPSTQEEGCWHGGPENANCNLGRDLKKCLWWHFYPTQTVIDAMHKFNSIVGDSCNVTKLDESPYYYVKCSKSNKSSRAWYFPNVGVKICTN